VQNKIALKTRGRTGDIARVAPPMRVTPPAANGDNPDIKLTVPPNSKNMAELAQMTLFFVVIGAKRNFGILAVSDFLALSKRCIDISLSL
jgi:hypothetical protein